MPDSGGPSRHDADLSCTPPENNYFSFGTSRDLESSPNFFIIQHTPFPLPAPVAGDANYDNQYTIPVAKVLGAAR
jgi:hypothetical protein